MNKYRDYDNYLKEYPTGDGCFGKYGGSYLADAVELFGAEPLGRGPALGDHAASITYGKEGVMHGFNSIMLADEKGEPVPVYSNASGLGYPAGGRVESTLAEERRQTENTDRRRSVRSADDLYYG